MKNFEVELSITQSFNTKVMVVGDFEDKNDEAISRIAKRLADNMAHDEWQFEETEFEINNVIPVKDRGVFIGEIRDGNVLKFMDKALSEKKSKNSITIGTSGKGRVIRELRDF